MSSKTKASVEQVAKLMDKQAGKHIGSIVMWTLLEPAVAQGDLKAIFAKHDLDWDAWGPWDLDGEITFHKSIAEAKRTTAGWRFVTLLDGKEKKVIGVVSEAIDKAAEDVKYRTDWTTDAVKLTYDKVNQAVKTTNPNHPVSKQVLSVFKRLEDVYTTPDFIRWIVRNLKETAGAIQLRPTGGTYFMPAKDYDLVLKHKAVIEECGSEFTVLNVKEDEISRQDLGRSAMRSMGDELKVLEEELDRWKDSPPRADTIGRRIEEYKALRSKAETYASMLSIKADDLLTNLAGCTKKAKDILGIVEQAKDEKAAAKVKVDAKVAAKVANEKQATATAKAAGKTVDKPAAKVVVKPQPVTPLGEVKREAGKPIAKVVEKVEPTKQPIKQAIKAIAEKLAESAKAKKATSKVKVSRK